MTRCTSLRSSRTEYVQKATTLIVMHSHHKVANVQQRLLRFVRVMPRVFQFYSQTFFFGERVDEMWKAASVERGDIIREGNVDEGLASTGLQKKPCKSCQAMTGNVNDRCTCGSSVTIATMTIVNIRPFGQKQIKSLRIFNTLVLFIAHFLRCTFYNVEIKNRGALSESNLNVVL